MQLWGQLHAYGSAGLASTSHHISHACLADEIALRIAVQYCGHQAWLTAVELGTGLVQAYKHNDHFYAKVQPCAHRQAQQVDASRVIFASATWRY